MKKKGFLITGIVLIILIIYYLIVGLSTSSNGIGYFFTRSISSNIFFYLIAFLLIGFSSFGVYVFIPDNKSEKIKIKQFLTAMATLGTLLIIGVVLLVFSINLSRDIVPDLINYSKGELNNEVVFIEDTLNVYGRYNTERYAYDKKNREFLNYIFPLEKNQSYEITYLPNTHYIVKAKRIYDE